MVSMHNMLLQSTGFGLDHYHIAKTAAGKLPDPFSWPHLNLSTDMGADNVAMDHYLAYQGHFNNHTDWDLSHGAHNDVCKDALKHTGLWRHMLSMLSAMNCAYGSTMSPPRLQQVRDAVSEYMTFANPATDAWFQLWLPHIIDQLGLSFSPADDSAAEQVWENLRDSPMLWYKSAKTNVSKYFLAVKRSREDSRLHAVKACLYGYACFQLGLKKTTASVAPSSGAASSSSGSAAAPAEGMLLKQAAKSTEEQTWKGENQLHTASIVYADMESYYKQNIIIAASAATETWYSEQNKLLRSAGSAIEWETRMMNGELQVHVLEAVRSLNNTEKYPKQGVECEWSRIDAMSASSPRVCMSDDHCELLWDLVFTLVCNREARLMPIAPGYPRQFTLLLDNDSRPGIIRQFKADYENCYLPDKLGKPWSREWTNRSLFQRLTNRQVGLCFTVEKWEWTSRMEAFIRQLDPSKLAPAHALSTHFPTYAHICSLLPAPPTHHLAQKSSLWVPHEHLVGHWCGRRVVGGGGGLVGYVAERGA